MSCSECRFWGTGWKGKKRACTKITDGRNAKDEVLAQTEDTDYEKATTCLVTRGDFGCILFEEK